MKISEPVLKEIRSMMEEGLSDTEISQKVGFSRRTITDRRKRWNIPTYKQIQRAKLPAKYLVRENRVCMEQKLSLCWKCIHAVPDTRGHGCPWSRDFEPVDGWTAKEGRYFSQKNGKRVANVMYGVQACPLFESG